MATKDTQQFCVRWNSYQSNLQSAFPKLLSCEHFVDVTLACESRMVKCHKVVLSACSAYFEKLLVQNPCQHPIIFMKDMKFWEVQALVDFMYKGEVNVTQDELGTLLKAAEALEVRGLCGQQEQGLAAKLSLPRDTVMAGDNSQKPRRVEAEVKEEQPSSQTQEASQSAVASPSAPDQSKQVSQSTSSVKQETKFVDNGLFDDFEDDFYQDDNSLQIDETGASYSLPGPSNQLDSSPDAGAWHLNNGYPNVILTEQSTYSSPSPSSETPGKVQRIRRSDAELLNAADSICKGMTFQKASQVFNIPMSTIRFYMARKGMLPSRRRGRRISQSPGSESSGSAGSGMMSGGLQPPTLPVSSHLAPHPQPPPHQPAHTQIPSNPYY